MKGFEIQIAAAFTRGNAVFCPMDQRRVFGGGDVGSHLIRAGKGAAQRAKYLAQIGLVFIKMFGPIGQDDSHICAQAPRQHTHLQGVGRTKNFEQIWVRWEIGEIDLTLPQTFRLQLRQAGRVNEAKGN